MSSAGDRVQKTTDPDDQSSARRVYTSSIQKRTAYEGAYDNAFKANFTTRSVDWSSSHGMVYRRQVHGVLVQVER